MNRMDIIRTRKSVRTFDGRPLSEMDRQKLCAYITAITNPWDIPVKFVLLDAVEHGLSSPVITGERLYIAAKVPRVERCEEAYGYAFEQMVLYAWSLGIGTTLIGGTMKREVFEKAANTGADEYMPLVSPLGYPAKERTAVDVKLRNSVHGDERLAVSELFYEGDFSRSVATADNLLEAVRWAPSAANMQPCRVVRDGNNYHFYEKHTKGYAGKIGWDVQRIDVGIAVCNLMSVAGGVCTVADPGIAVDEDTEYIATVRT